MEGGVGAGVSYSALRSRCVHSPSWTYGESGVSNDVLADSALLRVASIPPEFGVTFEQDVVEKLSVEPERRSV